jgi:hypothetical protein
LPRLGVAPAATADWRAKDCRQDGPDGTETGLVVQVPAFINEGEKIRVDTSEGAYLSRA